MDEAERLARIAEIEAEEAERERLRPLRMLKALGEQADRTPESVDWDEAVEWLEAALAEARRRASSP